jgi:hypothetical protein
MGTWAIDALGNDDAGDWLGTLYDGDGLDVIDETLSAVATLDYVEAPQAAEALAAAEVIAHLQGRPDTTMPPHEELEGWVKSSKLVPTPALVDKAHQAIDRILADQSELLELWQESDEFEAWKASVLNLRSRVR